MHLLSIEDLIFKGTHNSYSCVRAGPLCVNHPPDQQIDDFGVWSLEIDFSLERHHGSPVPVVGHDGPGHGSCWGYFLSEYIELVLQARALQFRPVFIYLESKRWKRSGRRPWRQPADNAFAFQEKWDAGIATLQRACADRLVLLDQWIFEHDRWPYPLELAGKVVLYEPNMRSANGRLVGLRGTHAAHCVTPELVESAIRTGLPLERNGAVCEGGARALRLNQYQADWTFAYGVPPNPLVVDGGAQSSTMVDDAQGKRWRCGGEVSHGEQVSEQGTYRFPFLTLEKAVARARGITLATNGHSDPRRAGQGWTVLIKGDNAETLLEEEDIFLSLQPYLDNK